MHSCLDIFKGYMNPSRPQNLISPLVESGTNKAVQKRNTQLQASMNQNAESKSNNKKQNIIINYNNS